MKANSWRMLPVLMLLWAVAANAQEAGELAVPEEQAMTDTIQYALENNPSKQAAEWVNPDTGRSGAAVPVRTFENAQGQPCREFITTIIIGDREEQGYGTACRQPDGSWQLVGEEPQAPPPPPAEVRTYLLEPPPVYYGYPGGLYGPYNIYLSFNYIHRSGGVHHGYRYLDGRSFRHRHPHHVYRQVYLGPRFFDRYHPVGMRYDRHGGRQWRHPEPSVLHWKNPENYRREYREHGRYDDRRYDDRRRERYDDRYRGRYDDQRRGRDDDRWDDRRDGRYDDRRDGNRGHR